MSEGWTCSRCSTVNAADRFGCSNCGLLRHDAATVGSSAAGRVARHRRPRSRPNPRRSRPASRRRPPASPTGTRRRLRPHTRPRQKSSRAWSRRTATTAQQRQRPYRLWRRIPVGWLIFAVLIAGGAITGWYFNASRSTTGEITKAGDMTAADLRVGDCFDLKDPAADEIEDVTAGPCTAAHEFEMFFVGSMPAGDFPAESVFETYVTDNCYPAFSAVRRQALRRLRAVDVLACPDGEGWRAGDRLGAMCRVPPSCPRPDAVAEGLEPVAPSRQVAGVRRRTWPRSSTPRSAGSSGSRFPSSRRRSAGWPSPSSRPP